MEIVGPEEGVGCVFFGDKPGQGRIVVRQLRLAVNVRKAGSEHARVSRE